MRFHGITMTGPFISQKLDSLPVFVPSSDQGRIVWLTDGTIWYGSDTEWRSFAASSTDAVEEEDFYSDLLRTTIFLNASYDGFANENLVANTTMTFSAKENAYFYSTGQTIESVNLYDIKSNIPYVDYVLVYAYYIGAGMPSIEVTTNGGTDWFAVQNGKILRIPTNKAGNNIKLRLTAVDDGILESWGILYHKDLSADCTKQALTYRRFVAEDGQDLFEVSYAPEAITVFLNGDLMDSTDYTAEDGIGVIFNDPLEEGDIVYVLTFSTSTMATDTEYILRDGSVTYLANQSMGSYKLTNLANAVLDHDAVNLGQIDSLLNNFGSTLSEDLIHRDGSLVFTDSQSMGNNRITNLANAIDDYDAVNLSQLNTFIGNAVTSVSGKTGDVTLVKADVGLGNVNNTSDANKPISTATQTALSLKANLASPALTGVPTAPTAAVDTNTTQIATTEYVVNQGYTRDAVLDIGVVGPLATTGGSNPVISMPAATPISHGYMSAEDKFKLDFSVASSGTVTQILTTDGVIGGPINTSGTIKLTGQALAFHNLATSGMVARTAVGVVASRTITNGNGIGVINGDGISGNPTVYNTDGGSAQNIFKNISIGGVTISATVNNDTLNVISGNGIFVSGAGATKNMTIVNTDGGSLQGIFKNIVIPGYASIVSSSNNDSLTFVSGSGVSISRLTGNEISIENTDPGSHQNIFGSVDVFTETTTETISASGNSDVLAFEGNNNIELSTSGNRITISSKQNAFTSIKVFDMSEDIVATNNNDFMTFVPVGGIGLLPSISNNNLYMGFAWRIIDSSSPVEDRLIPNNTGFFVNTSGGVITVTLPLTATIGDVVRISDLNRTFNANNCTISRNGHNIDGAATNKVLNTVGQSITLVYSNTTRGWITVN